MTMAESTPYILMVGISFWGGHTIQILQKDVKK
jgi:hypothetical protein